MDISRELYPTSVVPDDAWNDVDVNQVIITLARLHDWPRNLPLTSLIRCGGEGKLKEEARSEITEEV